MAGLFNLPNITLKSSQGFVYGSNIVPSLCNVFDLGTNNFRFRDLYMSGNTIDMDGVRISANASGLIVNDGQLVPPGTVIYLAGSNVPTGYLEARGQTVSRSVYNRLFVSISTIFGVGDGSTTFTLPDLRGEFIRGWDNGRGVDTGRAFGNAQTHNIVNHKHETAQRIPSWNVDTWFIGNSAPWGTGTTVINHRARTETTGSGTTTGGAYTNPEYVTDTGETRPRNLSLLACIKT